MRAFCIALILIALCSCTRHAVKLPKTRITPSSYFLPPSYYEGSGANFFNEEEDFERMLVAKRMGINWIRLSPSKWKSALYPKEAGTFLVGKKDRYDGIIKEDLLKLISVLDWAYELDIKVVLTFLSVPGRVFAQHNGGKQDTRLWSSFDKQDEAIQFFSDVALYVGHHPALLALNPINEPAPETATPTFIDWEHGDYGAWYERIKGSPQDLNQFYARAVKAIRKVRRNLPIMLDAGLYAHPWAFKIMQPLDDQQIYYSFHWYLPFGYAQKEVATSYPGKTPALETKGAPDVMWTKETLAQYLAPVIHWAKQHNVDTHRMVAGEFGVNRLLPGAKTYLEDLRQLFIAQGYLHAFYSFREPHFPRMDYELGAQPKIYPYWQALEAGVSPNYAELGDPEFLDALGLTPPLLKKPLKGLSTWNTFGPNINHQLIIDMMDALTKNGLKDLGYDTIMIDGGWRAAQLAEDNRLVADAKKFPHGMKILADEAHTRGFRLGLHIPVGSKDCGDKTEGTFGHEKVNAALMAEWGVDLVKLDQCLLDESEDWPKDVLRATMGEWYKQLIDTPIEIMASASRYYPWYPYLAHYGRTTLDLRPKIFGGARFNEPLLGEFISVVEAARQNSLWFHENSESYLNDPDMLVIENGLSSVEDKSHVAMWVMMNAPLLLGNDPRTMSEQTLSLLKNDALLAIHDDQFDAGRIILDEKDVLVFRKRLENGGVAFLFVNLKEREQLTRSFSYSELKMLKPHNITSAFSHRSIKVGSTVTISLKPHDSELLVLTPTPRKFSEASAER